MSDRPLSLSAVKRVQESMIGWLTTLRPDGSPHTTPVWFVYYSGRICVASGARNAKVGNIRHDPRVSVAIEGTSDAPMVAQGTANLAAVADVSLDVIDSFSRKYSGWDVRDSSMDGDRVVISIDISRWLLAG
ncbi:pyridoxamine 5'-phosphate oxidase family protein [Salinibacterium sp. PAMC 21357]|uniref:pyridoxamine 5'-phosphate oxidase family protein n=1 Tax=Salinibacterium sp. PAMC 21357 TaxID=1112215 RepID=UPI00028A0D80|nr:pyridoxamine 5'-phosphate oxidase family protein [Salinibacterium sp. PAMC 21357]